MNPEALRISREVIRDKSKSFYVASRLLPRRERDFATIVYAWCRRADDTVDEGDGDKSAALALLRRELDGIEAGTACTDPVVAGFAEVTRQCQIPLLYPRELLAGMESDLDAVCYQRMDELYEYCYRVAGTVGLMMAHVMGVREDRAVENAAHLGIAMQLTNIARDVVEDWERGRLYLPGELLARHGCGDLGDDLGGPFPACHARAVASAVAELLAIADRYYASGDRGLGQLPWRSSLAIAAARHIYADIGRVLRERRCDVTAGRAYVSSRRKLQLVGQSLASRGADLRHNLPWARVSTPSRSLAFSEMPRL